MVFLTKLSLLERRIQSFPGPFFPASRMNMERYSVSLHIQRNYLKIRTSETPNMDTFHPVFIIREDSHLN